MQRYSLSILFLVLLYWSCSSPAHEASKPETETAEQGCTFQMQGMQSIPNSQHKVVTALRSCNAPTSISRELILFAQGEPIDNEKKCNILATTDTSIHWQFKLAPKRIAVFFDGREPHPTTILLKANTVNDTIEVTYHVLNAAEI